MKPRNANAIVADDRHHLLAGDLHRPLLVADHVRVRIVDDLGQQRLALRQFRHRGHVRSNRGRIDHAGKLLDDAVGDEVDQFRLHLAVAQHHIGRVG